MSDIIKELYDKICTIDTLEEYQNVIPDSIEKMDRIEANPSSNYLIGKTSRANLFSRSPRSRHI